MRYYEDQEAHTDGLPGKTVTFTYNALGQLTGYSDGITVGSYEHDILGRLVEVSVNYGPFTKTHSYTWNEDGRKATYTNPEGVTYEYAYTPDGDFLSLKIPGEGSIAVTEYQWRAPLETQYPGGTRIRIDVDGLLRPQDTTLLDVGQSPRASRRYSYNLENHITAIQTESGEHVYSYDQLYRLILAEYAESIGLTDEAYTYDGVGNRLTENQSEPWSYNENHQLLLKAATETPTATFEHDANGHTIRKEEADGTVTIYEYNLAERLTRVRVENGPVLGTYQREGRVRSHISHMFRRFFPYGFGRPQFFGGLGYPRTTECHS